MEWPGPEVSAGVTPELSFPLQALLTSYDLWQGYGQKLNSTIILELKTPEGSWLHAHAPFHKGRPLGVEVSSSEC